MKKGERFNPYRVFHGIYIPAPIVDIPVRQLSQGAKIAYGRLCRYGGKDGEVFPKRETLAHEVGCGVRQVDSYIRELKDYKLLEVERLGLGQANRYYFVWHEIFDENIASKGTDIHDSAITELKNNDAH